MAIFTPKEREALRGELVSAARLDSNLCGAAHTGSAAESRVDRWSDIDLALGLKATASYDQVVAEWTEQLYQRHNAVAHVDVMRGTTLFRVFLLRNTLQVDLAFWRNEDFGAIGPSFRLIFGAARALRSAPESDAQYLIGMAWLYALHVRSSLGRERVLQAEYMLSGMRNQLFELVCLRCGVIAKQGRGLDDLPVTEKHEATQCIPRSLEPAELKRAFLCTMEALVKEIQYVKGKAETRLTEVLKEMAV